MKVVYFTVLIQVYFSAAATLNEVKDSKHDSLNLPQAKRLEQTQHIKNYVENTKERSKEHSDHTHLNPLTEGAGSRYSGLHGDSYGNHLHGRPEELIHGEASQYNPPNPSSNVLKPVRRVEDTQVDCHKNHMTVIFRFSAPFNGFIYPHENFMRCILFSGQNSNEASLTLHHGPCGRNSIQSANDPEFKAVIEHRLMIQWERDFICEDDSSVIVRCDRPDDFNKTISWNFQTLNLGSTLERNTHPGPKMWMDIQRGEGPNAPPLDNEPVFIGDVLTIVFTLSDNVFWFGSNILTCTAVDGGDDGEGYSEVDKYTPSVKTYSGRMTVIENECSTKPKIFSHFYKERITKDGNLVNLHYAHFKAFRFPTSQKVVLQCDVKVCYKNCESLPLCSVGFQPRTAKERNRREAQYVNKSQNAFEEGSELETFLLYRTIEVFSAEDGALREIPVKASTREPKSLVQDFEYYKTNCYTSQTFFSWISVFALSTIFLAILLVWQMFKCKIEDKACTFPKN